MQMNNANFRYIFTIDDNSNLCIIQGRATVADSTGFVRLQGAFSGKHLKRNGDHHEKSIGTSYPG